MMRVGIVEVFVDDQDAAKRFYVDVLGFRIKVDADYGSASRWLTVVSPDDPDGAELLLAPAVGAAGPLQAERRASGTPTLSLTTDDCQKSYEELRARGATFVSEPEHRSYGGIDAVFEDGCGNLLNLHEA
jgi:catechol 2,3-dioxygenase-like lactoylglutathione lyase family enzyme